MFPFSSQNCLTIIKQYFLLYFLNFNSDNQSGCTDCSPRFLGTMSGVLNNCLTIYTISQAVYLSLLVFRYCVCFARLFVQCLDCVQTVSLTIYNLYVMLSKRSIQPSILFVSFQHGSVGVQTVSVTICVDYLCDSLYTVSSGLKIWLQPCCRDSLLPKFYDL